MNGRHHLGSDVKGACVPRSDGILLNDALRLCHSQQASIPTIKMNSIDAPAAIAPTCVAVKCDLSLSVGETSDGLGLASGVWVMLASGVWLTLASGVRLTLARGVCEAVASDVRIGDGSGVGLGAFVPLTLTDWRGDA